MTAPAADEQANIMLARYYSSSLARFMAVDPALGSAQSQIPQSWNRYAYALNNPLLLIDPTGTTVAVSGPKQRQGLKDLSDKTGLTLSVDAQGDLQSEDFVGPRTLQQEVVETAIGSSATISLNFESGNGEYNYARRNGPGKTDVDIGDTAALNDRANRSSFTAGGVVVHELAEALARVDPSVAGGLKPHSFANTISPGLTQNPTFIPTGVWGNRVLSADLIQTVQDGSGTQLITSQRFAPPIIMGSGMPAVGPVTSVRSKP